MKKILTTFILSLIIFSFTGCGESKEEQQAKYEFKQFVEHKVLSKKDYLEEKDRLKNKYGEKLVEKWIDSDKELKAMQNWVDEK